MSEHAKRELFTEGFFSHCFCQECNARRVSHQVDGILPEEALPMLEHLQSKRVEVLDYLRHLEIGLLQRISIH